MRSLNVAPGAARITRVASEMGVRFEGDGARAGETTNGVVAPIRLRLAGMKTRTHNTLGRDEVAPHERERDVVRLLVRRSQTRTHLSLLVAFTCCFAVFAVLCFAAFMRSGTSSIRVYDALDQHFTMFVYEGRWLRSIVRESLAHGRLTVPLWDTSIGYGADIIVSLGAYLGDPLNLLSALIPSAHAEAGFMALQVLRLYLAGLAFSVYALSRGVSRFGTLVGALTYAFSGWALITPLQPFFIVPLMLMPLMLWGADRVLQGRSPYLLIVSSALMFAAYFYFGYVSCLVLLVYCLIATIDLRQLKGLSGRELARCAVDEVVLAVRVLAAIALGGAMAAWIVLPTVTTILGQGRIGIEHAVPFLYRVRYYVDLLVGLVDYASVGSDAYLGCGGLCVVAGVLLFAQRGHRQTKLCLVAGTIALLLPVAGWVANGMTYVTNRWAFAYALGGCMALARMTPHFFGPRRPAMRVAACVLALIGCVAVAAPDTRESGALVSLLSPCLLLVAMGAWSRMERGATFGRRCIVLALAALAVALPTYRRYMSIMDSMVQRGSAFERVAGSSASSALAGLGDDSLYRYDLMGVRQVNNESMLSGEHGYDFYISLYNGAVEQFEKELELDRVVVAHQVSGPRRCSYLEAALGTKYFMVPLGDEQLLPFGFSHTPVMVTTLDGREVGIYRNELNLPLCYALPQTLSPQRYEQLTAPEKRQMLLQAVTVEGEGSADAANLEFLDQSIPYEVASVSEGVQMGDNTLYVPHDGDSITLRFDGVPHAETAVEFRNLQLVATESATEGSSTPSITQRLALLREQYLWNGPASYHVALEASNGVRTFIDGRMREDYLYGGRDSKLVTLCWSEEPLTSVTISFGTAGRYTFDALNVIAQPLDKLSSYIEAIRSDPVEVSEHVNGYHITSTTQVERYLYLTVPWSAGWRGSIDGVPAEVLKANGAFMAIPVPAGSHEVDLVYTTPWLGLGGAISAAGVLATVLLVIYRRHRAATKGQAAQSFELE